MLLAIQGKNNIKSDDANEADDKYVDMLKNPTINFFCHTQWTVRAECLNGVIKNFDELQGL